MTLPDFVWGALGAALGWPVVEFIARPFRQFYDIRRQVARAMVVYGNVSARAKLDNDYAWKPTEITPEEDARLTEAQNTFRGLASDMRAFANGEKAANWIVKCVGYDANKIASALIGYSNQLSTYGLPRDQAGKHVEKLLGIRSSE
jgi:hypothetical protein